VFFRDSGAELQGKEKEGKEGNKKEKAKGFEADMKKVRFLSLF